MRLRNFLAIPLLVLTAGIAVAGPRISIWDGVYTDAQADRGHPDPAGLDRVPRSEARVPRPNVLKIWSNSTGVVVSRVSMIPPSGIAGALSGPGLIWA